MDAQLLNELIENPDKATIEQALLVHELVVKYPYFQSARVLHLKLLSLSDYPAFIKELPNVATYAGDRKILYHYINPEKNKRQKLNVENTEPNPKIESAQEPTKEKPEKDITVESSSVEVETEEANKDEAIHIKEDFVSEKEQSETLSFAQWLDNLATQVQKNEDQKERIKEAKPDEDNKPEKDKNEPNNAAKTTLQGGLTDERWALIDSFLQEYKPTSPKPTTEPIAAKEEVIDLSSHKPEQDKEIITETLADIFLAQKNYKKAIEIFEKLRLKYPEKNVYFADLIKKAKKQRKKDNKKTE